MRQRVIAILGMHRSGTSVITQGLAALGVDLGSSLMPPIPGVNDKGFSEDLQINALNIEILSALGKDWSSVAPITPDEINRKDLDIYRSRATDLLGSKLAGLTAFGFKDPRLCKLLPFWRRIFTSLNLDDSYIIALRNPLSVAESLCVRDGFDPEKSHLLWLGHIIPAMQWTESKTRVIVDYDLMMDDPIPQLKRMAAALGLDHAERKTGLSDFAGSFLEKGLRHTTFDPASLDIDSRAPKLAVEAYRLLMRYARDEEIADGPKYSADWRKIRETFEALTPACQLLDRETLKITAATQTIKEREDKIAFLSHAVSERDGLIVSLSRTIGERDEWISKLNQTIAERDALAADGQNRLAAVLNSKSWRLTAPFRAGLATIRRLIKGPISASASEEAQPVSLSQSQSGFAASQAAPSEPPSDDEVSGVKTPLVFFTICSKNFTAYAKTLFDSIVRFHPDAVFYMALCDNVDSGYKIETLPFSVIQLDQLEIPDIKGMISRYNITELNTAIKPYVFSYLFSKRNCGKVVYLDPDILVVSRLAELEEELEKGAEAVLTPHILAPAENVEISDVKMLQFGIYNLGFVALRDSPAVRSFVKWWERRLEHDCVIRLAEGLFVDQKWADLLPAFVPRTSILHHPGYNVAYWNLSQRKIERNGGQWLSNNQSLRFVHFSGNKIEDPGVFSRHSGTITISNIGDLKLLLDEYRDKVFANGHGEYLKLPYSFNWNGAGGVNLHAPKPAHQPEPGDLNRAGSGPAGAAPASSPQPGSFRQPGWKSVVMAARSISGGWLPMAKKIVRVVRRGGISEALDRINLARATVFVPQRASQGSSAASAVRPIPKVFVTDWSTPRPDHDAGSLTTFFLLRNLVELGYDVTFVPSDLLYLDGYTESLRWLGVKCLHKKDIGTVHNHLVKHGAEYSLFVICRAPIAAFHMADIKRFAPQAKIVFETVDLHYLREERRAESNNSDKERMEAARTKKWELNIISNCDVSIVMSPVEKELLEKELPGADIRHLPLLFLDMSGPSSRGFEDRKDILFIGGFRHEPNIDAVVFFCNEVWPSVRARLPEARFLIVGSNAPQKVADLGAIPGVTALGHVKDIDPLFAGARLSVAPLRYGAGIKGKIITSLGHGVPVVGTGVAIEGMGLVPGQHAVVADGPEEFADAVVRVYTDQALWRRLSDTGFQRAYELYSEHAGRARIAGLMASLNLKSSDFEFFGFSSYDEYWRHRIRAEPDYARRTRTELDLIRHDAGSFFVEGYCAVCESHSKFQTGFMYSYKKTGDGKPIPNWREHLNCVRCGFTNRIRATSHFLENVLHPPAKCRIYMTEQTTPLFRRLKKRYPKTIGSEFLGVGVPPGAKRNGIRNENLTALTFADASFDLIISLDVLEHVPDDMAAFSECYRVLAPGGALMFTAPFDLGSRVNLIRARVNPNGEIEHILPPEYHGNPVDPENGALSFRSFGWEIIEQLKKAGFGEAKALTYWSRDLGYLGEEQVIFLARK